MHLSTLPLALSALALFPFALSTPTPTPDKTTYPGFIHPSNGDCTDYAVTSTVTYEQLQWAQPRYKDNFEVAGLLSRVATQPKYPLPAFSGSKNVTKEFTIAGTFCKPKASNAKKQNTVFVATHGAGFDRRYWASSYKPSDYSFAQYALSAGYSIFYYDRLGVGKSSRLSGYDIEINPQVELLGALLRSLRQGKYTAGIKPSNLVIVGHSFGSVVSNLVLGRYPELVEGAVLTGFSFPTADDPAASASGYGLSVFASRIVSTLAGDAVPQFAPSFDNGWLSFADKFAFTEAFLGASDYEVSAAEYSFKIAQPYSIVDFLSAFAQPSVADRYEGKLLLAPAERDLFFCAGDCKDTFARGGQNASFPNPKTDVSLHVQEGAGHGQNFALNAKDLYGAIVGFADTL